MHNIISKKNWPIVDVGIMMKFRCFYLNIIVLQYCCWTAQVEVVQKWCVPFFDFYFFFKNLFRVDGGGGFTFWWVKVINQK